MTTLDAIGANDEVVQAVHGCRQAESLVLTLRTSIVPPDALFEALQAVDELEQPALMRAFCRRLQKVIETAR